MSSCQTHGLTTLATLILRSRALARRLEGWAASTEPVILRGSQELAPQDDDLPARPRTCWMMPEKSSPPLPSASNALKISCACLPSGVAAPAAFAASCASVRSLTIRAEAKPGL